MATMIMMLLWCLRETIHVNNLESWQPCNKGSKCHLLLILPSPLIDEAKFKLSHVEFSQSNDWLKWNLYFIWFWVTSPAYSVGLGWCLGTDLSGNLPGWIWRAAQTKRQSWCLTSFYLFSWELPTHCSRQSCL